jgi:hypothetical protein
MLGQREEMSKKVQETYQWGRLEGRRDQAWAGRDQ